MDIHSILIGLLVCCISFVVAKFLFKRVIGIVTSVITTGVIYYVMHHFL